MITSLSDRNETSSQHVVQSSEQATHQRPVSQSSCGSSSLSGCCFACAADINSVSCAAYESIWQIVSFLPDSLEFNIVRLTKRPTVGMSVGMPDWMTQCVCTWPLPLWGVHLQLQLRLSEYLGICVSVYLSDAICELPLATQTLFPLSPFLFLYTQLFDRPHIQSVYVSRKIWRGHRVSFFVFVAFR